MTANPSECDVVNGDSRESRRRRTSLQRSAADAKIRLVRKATTGSYAKSDLAATMSDFLKFGGCVHAEDPRSSSSRAVADEPSS